MKEVRISGFVKKISLVLKDIKSTFDYLDQNLAEHTMDYHNLLSMFCNLESITAG
jgi:hypothetical protein